jgi:hypothetical protein
LPIKTKCINVQLQRFTPQTATVTVQVPADWDEARIKAELSGIYAEAIDQGAVDRWHDQMDGDAREGTHEVDVEPPRNTVADFIYDPDEVISDA